MTKAEKALAACKEYDRLMTEIRKNTKTIGDGVDECDRYIDATDPSGIKDVRYIPDGKDTHLSEVFAGYDEDGMFEPIHFHYSRPEALEIIGDCKGCRKAYEAVQERKANKKKLGAIKRTIRAIGRAA